VVIAMLASKKAAKPLRSHSGEIAMKLVWDTVQLVLSEEAVVVVERQVKAP
jgi:hypothetical protein